ncbi:hypothetical protein CFC21_040372, partial [Triticum aestivum]
EDFK